MATQAKMLNIRIGYDTGRKLKAVCALRGKTVRDVIEEFADAYVKHAHELPPMEAPQSVRAAGMAASMARAYADQTTPSKTKGKR